ncbi:MAG: replicative DNA helicase [Candidatus Goldiibacteriota bacterium]
MADDKLRTAKVPPQNNEAEQSLLGSILLSTGRSIDVIASLIEPEDFYDPKHRNIYAGMKKLSEKSDAIDALTLVDELNSSGLLDSAGGASYITMLSDIVPTAAHIEDYAEIVKEKSNLRKLIDLSTEIIENAYTGSREPSDIIETAENKIFGIAEREHGTMTTVKELIHNVYERIQEMGANPEKYIGMETGYKYIDEATSGFKEQELIIVAARPSLGKTSLVLNIAHKLSVRKRKNILMFSFEMSAEDLIRRLLAIGSRVNIQKIRTGKYLTKEEKEKIMEAAGRLSDTNFCIDTGDNTVFEMRAKTRSYMSQLRKDGKKLDMIIVDYMQLVRPDPSIKVREQQIANISRSLKALAREANVPVIALSQLNRESEKRDRTRPGAGSAEKAPAPKLSDLRESGAIEQDADMVMFIHREDNEIVDVTVFDDAGVEKRQGRRCRLIIEKNRNGPVASQKVWFIPDLTAFEERTEQEQEPEAGGGNAAGAF